MPLSSHFSHIRCFFFQYLTNEKATFSVGQSQKARFAIFLRCLLQNLRAPSVVCFFRMSRQWVADWYFSSQFHITFAMTAFSGVIFLLHLCYLLIVFARLCQTFHCKLPCKLFCSLWKWDNFPTSSVRQSVRRPVIF